MTRFDACAGLQGGQPFDGEAVARLLSRYGIGPAEQAAVRAFGRIVSATELATGPLERLNLDDEHAEAGLGRALRGFCRGPEMPVVVEQPGREGDRIEQGARLA